jgi:hypothetical protein
MAEFTEFRDRTETAVVILKAAFPNFLHSTWAADTEDANLISFCRLVTDETDPMTMLGKVWSDFCECTLARFWKFFIPGLTKHFTVPVSDLMKMLDCDKADTTINDLQVPKDDKPFSGASIAMKFASNLPQLMNNVVTLGSSKITFGLACLLPNVVEVIQQVNTLKDINAAPTIQSFAATCGQDDALFMEVEEVTKKLASSITIFKGSGSDSKYFDKVDRIARGSDCSANDPK